MRDYRFLFETDVGGNYPTFLRSQANVYQLGDSFYETSLQINLREITKKPILDAWVVALPEALAIYLLVENMHSVVDEGHYKIGQLTRDFLKVVLNRSKIHAILRKREFMSDPEACVFGVRPLYNHLMSNCRRMIVLNESNSLFVFVTDTAIALLSPLFTKVFTFSQQETLHLSSIVGPSCVIKMPGGHDKIVEFDFKIVGPLVLLYVNGCTLGIHGQDNTFSVCFCEQPLCIGDIDFVSQRVAVTRKPEGVSFLPFELERVHVTESGPVEIARMVIFESPESEGPLKPVSGQSFLLKATPQSSAVLFSDKIVHFGSLKPQIKPVPFSKKTECVVLSACSKTNPRPDFDFICVGPQGEVFVLRAADETTETVLHLPSFTSAEDVLSVVDGFVSDEYLLLVSRATLQVFDQASGELVTSVHLSNSKITNAKVVSNLVLVTFLGQETFGIFKMDQGQLRQTAIPVGLEATVAFDFLGDDLYIVDSAGHFRASKIEDVDTPRFLFELAEFDNVIFDSLMAIEAEKTRTTHSVTNLAINIPKIGGNSTPRVADVRYFEFLSHFYFIFWSAEGHLHLYRHYPEALVKVPVQIPFFAPPGGCVEVIVLGARALIKAGSKSVWLLTTRNGKEEIDLVFSRECRFLGVSLAGDVVGLLGSVPATLPLPSGEKEVTPAFAEGVVQVLALKSAKSDVGEPRHQVFLLHFRGLADQVSVMDASGNILAVHPLSPGQTVTCLKDVSSTSGDGPSIIFLGLLTVLGESGERRAKRQMLSVSLSREGGALKCKLNVLLDQLAQEPHRSITNCFTFGAVMFVCLDDRLLRIEGDKLVKYYEMGMCSIKHVAQSQNLLVLGDCTGLVSCFIWNSKTLELVEQSSTVVPGGIREMALENSPLRVSLTASRGHRHKRCPGLRVPGTANQRVQDA